jgi:hypothetical protein
VSALDADPTIAAAIAQDIQCLHDQGIDRVTEGGYITDGYNMAHPDQIGLARHKFEQCFPPVVAARAPVRKAFRDTFVAEHQDQIHQLQAALDDYLRAIYQPAPHARTVTTEPDLARFDDGCIRVTNPYGGPVNVPSDTALATARRVLREPAGEPTDTRLGKVIVCDRAAIRDRVAWVLAFPSKLVVVDANSGKVLLVRGV